MLPRSSAATPSGKFGFRVTVKERENKRAPYTTLYDKTEEFPHVPTTPNPGLTASVGLSISAGLKHKDFARQTLEVSAWCTMPCEPAPEAIQKTYDECYNYVVTQVNDRMVAAGMQFFPELVGATGG